MVGIIKGVYLEIKRFRNNLTREGVIERTPC